MESSGRKLLPRVTASSAERKEDVGGEALRNGNGIVEDPANTTTLWKPPMDEEGAPKRKRQQVEENSPRSQTLPGLRTLFPVSQPPTVDNDRAGPARLIPTTNDGYVQEGRFHFLAPRPARDFPATIASDPRELSFAHVEPELMNCFKHAYYLRHHLRPRRISGELWYDHTFYNDAYGIDSIIKNWTSRYEPGTLQNPVGLLYKQCLWLYFNRSIQLSTASPAFRQMVDDGLHFLQTFENLLGPSGDRSVLLVPIFILGSTAYYSGQRREIVGALDRLDPSFSVDAVTHAARSLERLWEMMDDGRIASTWDWEKYQAHDSTMATADRSLIELLWDPLMPQAPIAQAPRVRSPEQYDFDPSRFRAAPPAVAPQPPPPEHIRHQREEAEFYSPPHARSPPRQMSASVENEGVRPEGTQESNPSNHVELAAGPRPFLAPPPPSSSVHSNNELLQVLHRKSAKSKSTVPPCPTCGKELKNPSDAQKHQLQHSKPFRCREPGCTRTQGFATENDLQRHRKSVHGASPRIGNKIGYICSACPDPSDGTSRKWWPRLDNFKAHIRRKHSDQEEESLIQSSASARRPEDSYESGYASSAFRTPQSHLRRQYEEHETPHESDYSQLKQEDDEEGLADRDQEGDNSDDEENQDPSSPRSRSGGSSMSSANDQNDAMDVSPSAERGE